MSKNLDAQLAQHEDRLIREVGLTNEESRKVTVFIEKEIRFFPLQEAQMQIQVASPVAISKRLEELEAFQLWTEYASSIQGRPGVARANVITMIYICVVYPLDACFKIIAHSNISDASVVARCTKYLSTGKRRKFRNAFVHANWQYKSDFSGLECWTEERGCRENFDVSQEDFTFWCDLSRGVSYTVFTTLRDRR